MKRSIFFLLIFALILFVIAGTSQGFQGRMGGMGDPYGLVSDEADFLIHPAKIAGGEGVRFYGHYRFTYTDVMDRDYDLDVFTTAGTLTEYYHFDTSGEEYVYDAQLGAAFPLGPGRMGVFFTYEGMSGDYDGDEVQWDGSAFFDFEYDLTSGLDEFALRLLYGLPMMGMDMGLELGMTYRDEKQETWLYLSDLGFGTQNYIWSWNLPQRSLFPFMIPYDADYWELLWKAGMGKQFDSMMGIDISLRGGYIVSADNRYEYSHQEPVGDYDYNADMDGDVAGWRIGSDIWFRYGLGDGLTLPFLFGIDYAEKNRDGDGIGTGHIDAGQLYDYEHEEQAFDIKLGGGIEKELGGKALVAAGLYYNYLQGKDAMRFSRDSVADEDSGFPEWEKHMAIIRLGGEKEFSPTLALRMGFDFFYGWVKEDFKHMLVADHTDDISLDGHHWGVGVSLGGTVQFGSFTVEPFVNGGYQTYDLSGEGYAASIGGVYALFDMDKELSEWYIAGGCSFLFDIR